MAATGGPLCRGARQGEVENAIGEAVQWLRAQVLVMPLLDAPSHMAITRRGRDLLRPGAFAKYRAAAAFPKALLHPTIAEKVWLSIARGDLADAVFAAFRAVEEAVRSAGGYGPTDIGTKLMRAAFGLNGPLKDQSQPRPEQEALEHLTNGTSRERLRAARAALATSQVAGAADVAPDLLR